MAICWLARIRPRPGANENLRRVLTGLVAPTRREPGCIAYNLHEERTPEGVMFSFYEVWREKADHTAHTGTPHLRAFLARQAELVEGEIEIVPMALIDP